MIGYRMCLEYKKDGQEEYRIFNGNDAVFFKGKPSWGTAPDLADGYEKKF